MSTPEPRTHAWFDGALVDPDAPLLRLDDRAFTVGDAVFETAKVVDGVPFALSRHLRRLAASARALGLAEPDTDLVRGGVEAVLAAAERPSLGRLRITYGGGSAPMGPGRGDAVPHVAVVLAPVALRPDVTSVVSVPWVRNERSAVAGVKTTSYAENVVALADAQARGASEALLANTRGELCEGTGTNVFVVLDGEILTPPLSSGCLAGVTRELVLEWCDAHERTVTMAELARADEVFLTSSTRDVQPVASVDGRELDAPGPRTAAVAAEFVSRAAEDVDP